MKPLCIVLINVMLLCTHVLWATNINCTKDLNSAKQSSDCFGKENTEERKTTFLKKLSFKTSNISDVPSSRKKDSTKNKFEGRGKTMDSTIVPAILSTVVTGGLSIVVAAMKMVVMKALIVAKMALVLSIILLIGHLAKKEHTSSPPIEISQSEASEVIPVYTEYSNPDGSVGNLHTENLNVGSFGDLYNTNYPVSAAAQSVLNYASVEGPSTNNTYTVVDSARPMPAVRRRDHLKRKVKVPMIFTIRHYT